MLDTKRIREGQIITREGVNYLVLKEATSFTPKTGVRMFMDNRRKNKWWVKCSDGGGEPFIMCFET